MGYFLDIVWVVLALGVLALGVSLGWAQSQLSSFNNYSFKKQRYHIRSQSTNTNLRDKRKRRQNYFQNNSNSDTIVEKKKRRK